MTSQQPQRVPGSQLNLSRSLVPVTPYSIFVHASPIYNTSDLAVRRSSRMGSRPHARPNRLLPLRPDGYPYANRRWSDRMTVTTTHANGEEAA